VSSKAWRPPSKKKAEAKGRGGISFEDDDLGEYMHPDDVPPRDPGGGTK
jgi:hypothetical protein